MCYPHRIMRVTCAHINSKTSTIKCQLGLLTVSNTLRLCFSTATSSSLCAYSL
ncbi:hypothetical protein SAMN05661109_02824, partial [Corynebacterium cystitidis DSM 20524]